MGTKKAATGDKPSAVKNPKHRGKPPHLGPTKGITKKKKAKTGDENAEKSGRNDRKSENGGEQSLSPPPYASDKLGFFVNEFESANGVRISSLELETIKDKSIVELSQDFVQDVSNLGKHIKTAFGSSWKEVLCEGMPVEGKIDPGNPSVLIIGLSALRSLELLRGVSSLTKQCSAVKLFSKHLKVEEQVSLLKNRVNIGSGTPSRIKKLIDIEALGLSRLEMVVLDLQTDLKGFSLFSLPQVRNEFWDLYKNYFHQRVLQGALRICLYGPIPAAQEEKKKKKQQQRKDREKRDADR